MKIAFLAFAGCFLSMAAVAQQRTINVDKDDVNISNVFYSISGEPFVNAKFVSLVAGTPYFKEEWIKGALLLENGKQYKGQLKLDLYDNEVHYLDSKGNEFITSIPIRQIIFTDPAYSFIHCSFLPKTVVGVKMGWYQQLYIDSTSLYKYYHKQLSENKPYNSATYEQTIKTIEIYYVLYNGNFVTVKKIKDAPALFGDKQGALEAFLKNEDNKNAPMDDRMIAFVQHLNTLIKTSK